MEFEFLASRNQALKEKLIRSEISVQELISVAVDLFEIVNEIGFDKNQSLKLVENLKDAYDYNRGKDILLKPDMKTRIDKVTYTDETGVFYFQIANENGYLNCEECGELVRFDETSLFEHVKYAH